MKKNTRLLVAANLVLITGVMFWSINNSTAQEKQAPTLSTEEKIDAIATQIGNLTSVVGNIQQALPQQQINEVIEPAASTSSTSVYNIGHPAGCGSYGSEYKDWPSSDYRKNDSDWNFNDFPSMTSGSATGLTYPNSFMDINGDGLLDFVHMQKYTNYAHYSPYTDEGAAIHLKNNESSCVFLNNGKGWDLVYKCVVGSEQVSSTPITYKLKYYGDCADTSQ